ncbi:hypothetical protein C8F01DRAFT_1105932 [Mycena amicta]|nr:hypothetical protein C8F01DRAFT_1105932 [Mycena amicta]
MSSPRSSGSGSVSEGPSSASAHSSSISSSVVTTHSSPPATSSSPKSSSASQPSPSLTRSSSIGSFSSSRASSTSLSTTVPLVSPPASDTQLSSFSSPTSSLAVPPAPSSSPNRVLIAAVVGSVGGVLLIGGIILVLLWRQTRRRRQQARTSTHGQFLMRERSNDPEDDQDHKGYDSARGWTGPPLVPGTPRDSTSGWARPASTATASLANANNKTPHYTVRGHSVVGPSGAAPSNIAGFGADIAWQEAHYQDIYPVPDPALQPPPTIGVVPPTPNPDMGPGGRYGDPTSGTSSGSLAMSQNPRHSTASSLSSVYSSASASAAAHNEREQLNYGYAYSGEDDDEGITYPHTPPGFDSSSSSSPAQTKPTISPENERTTRSPTADWAALPLP